MNMLTDEEREKTMKIAGSVILEAIKQEGFSDVTIAYGILEYTRRVFLTSPDFDQTEVEKNLKDIEEFIFQILTLKDSKRN